MASLKDKIESNAKKQGLKKKAINYSTIKEPTQQDPAVNRLRELAQAQKSKLANRNVRTSNKPSINRSAFAELTKGVTLSNADRNAKTPYVQKNKNTISDVIEQAQKTARVKKGLPATESIPKTNTVQTKANTKRYNTRGQEVSGKNKTRSAYNLPATRNNFRGDTGEWLKEESYGALTGLNAELASFADFILPDVITPKFVQKGIDYYRNANEQQQQAVQRLRGNSKTREILGTVGQNTLQMIPTAVMAYLSGGTSLATEAPSLLNPSTLTQTGNVISRAINQVAKDTGKNPMFWETFARTAGTTYDREIEEGASPIKATLSAFTNALLNAQIEIGGGVEVYDPSETFLKSIIRSAKEEGLEEVQQYAVENLTNKAIGSNKAQWFSLDKDTNAVINPLAMAEQGMYGALAGGLATGVRTGTVNLINDAVNSANNSRELKSTANLQKSLESLGVSKDLSAGMTESVQRILKGTATVEDKRKVASSPEVMQIFEVSEGVRNDANLSYSKLTEINDSIAKSQNRGYRNFESASTGSHLDYNPTRRTITGSNRVNADLMETMAPQRPESRLTPTRGVSQGNFTFQLGNPATSESVAPQQAQANLNIQTVERLSKDFPQGTRTQFVQAYDGQMDPVTYFEEMNNFRMEGRRGEDFVVSESALSPQQQQIAYNAGVQENEVHLRNSNEWNGSTNPTGQVQSMEEGTRQAEGNRGLYQNGSGSDVESESRIGREIDHSRISFDFANKIYEPGETTEDMEVVRRAGKEKGFNVNFFVGDYAERKTDSGTALERAWVDFNNKEIWIRSDDPRVNVKQIFGHEIFHTELENKEYKQTLLENVRNKVGDMAWDALLQAYSSAYAGTGMSIEELQEELLCDINGNLNGFRGIRGTERLSKLFERVGQEVKAEIDKTPKSNKAPPGEGISFSSIVNKKASTVLQDYAIADEYNDAQNEFDPTDIKFSTVTDKNLIRELNADEHQKTYRAMALIDGKLYPPMATKAKDEKGKWVLRGGVGLGTWIESDITTDSRMFDKDGKFHLKKDDGGDLFVAYNPYIHSSDTMLNDQFSSAYKRPNIVVVEGDIPVSELNSGYRAEHDIDDGRHVVAKDSTGRLEWKAGVVQGKLTGTRTVFLTNHFKPTRIVTDSEVAKHILSMVKGTNVVIPYNVVTPSLRNELLKLGVNMAQSKEKKYYVDLNQKYSTALNREYMDAVNSGDMAKAQKMVDEQAKKAGYDTSTKLYHGTNAEFNVFKSGFGQYGEGVYFTYSKDVAKDYARDYRDLSKGRVISVYTKPLNTADWEDLGNVLGIEDIWDYFDHLDELDAESDITNLEYHPESIDALIEAGFNSFIDDGNDGVVIFPTGEGGISSMVKSADPVTYDDQGKVIPLSERFNDKSNDIRFSSALGDSFTTDGKGNARWTDSRIDYLIKDYGSSNKDYSQAYAVLMNPRDYLKLTLEDSMLDEWNKNVADPNKPKYRPLNAKDLASERGEIYLSISSKNGTMVDGHEGRHRMRALMEAGIKSVPVVIKDMDTKYTKKHMASMTLSSQDFGYDPVNNNAKVTVRDLVPINNVNRAELIEKFGGNAKVKFSTAIDREYMEAVNSGDMKTAQKMVDEQAKKNGYNYKGYHGTNASFTRFDPEKLGSNNFMASSAYMGFFASKSKETADAYIGLNSADTISLMLNTESRGFMQRIQEKYNYEKRNAEVERQKEDFFDKYRADHGYKEMVDDPINALVNEFEKNRKIFTRKDGSDFFDNFLETFVPNHRTSLEIDWNKLYLNDMYNAWEQTKTFKDHQELEQQIMKEWEELEVKRRGYTPHVKELYIKLENPLIYDFKGEERDTESFAGRMAQAKAEGKDGCIFLNVADGADIDDIYTVFSNTQFKSADPVVYDDEGNIIPLSERFNEENEDIRFSTAVKQFDVIQKSNPMLDSYHSGIRSAKDIKTAQEVFSRDKFSGTPDWTYSDAQKALKDGKVTVYSSKEIVDGAFVTPSMMEAINYAGDGSFYQREVSLDNVAWIDSVEGQYAVVGNEDPESTVRFSVALHRNAFPKPVIQEGGEVVGESVYQKKGMPLLATTMEINAETLKMMGKSSQIPIVRNFLDRMANFMDDMAVKYTFIGLNDVNNATLEMRYDKDGNPVSIVVSAMVKNGEYPVNFDFSSICKKRQALSKMFQELGSKKRDGLIDKVELSQENLWEINKILSRNGYETACLGCFVETKRYNIEEWADSFVEKWNRAVKAINPNADYFNFGTRNDISYGYVGDELDKFAENKRSEVEKESKRRIKERDNWKKKYHKDNPSKTEADTEKAFKEWWQKQYNKKAKDYKESWFTKPALSNESAIVSLVNSGEKMQKLLKKSDIISPTGLKALMGLHRDFYGVLYGHYGSGTPKPMVAFTPYNSEIALLDRRRSSNGELQNYTKASNDKMIDKLIAIGGVRVQSFSDFLIQNVFDYMQMIADLSARDFPAHAYTKEIAFAKIFGLTGMKINLSVMFDVDPDGIAPGLDKDGNYVVADKARQDRERAKGREVFTFSISFDEARELQNQKGYDGNLGIIGVGLSDLHIRKMLNDKNIKMVIPYHASGMPAVIKQVTGLENATNYESTQNTLVITEVKDSNGKDVTSQYGREYFQNLYEKHGSWRSVFAEFRKDIEENGLKVTTKKKFGSVGDFPLYTGDSMMSLDVTNDPKRTAEYYMGWCVDQGAIPLFYQFADEENYYKVLYDFNVYKNDGTYAPQQAVTNSYPKELENIIEGYMNEANEFEKAQSARWEDVVDETEKMLRNNSFKASTVMPTIAELQRENDQLKQKVDYYKGQLKRTTRVSLRASDIKALVKDLKSSYSSLAESDDLTRRLKALGEELANGHGERGEVDFDRIKAGAVDIAQDIVLGASELVNDPTRQQYKDLVAWFKGKTIKVDNPSDFPDYNDFRKSVIGKMKLSKSSGHTMGSYWEALQQRFGKQLFPDVVTTGDGSESVNDSDLITYVLGMMNYADDVYENPFSFDLAGAIEHCSNELIDRLLDESVRQAPATFADRKERQIERLKIRNAQKVQEAITRERKKRDDKIKAFKDHQKEVMERRRVRRNDSDARTKLLKVARRLDKIKTTEANRALINSLIGELDLVAKGMTANTELKLHELQDWYEEQVELDPYFKDSNVENKLKRLKKKQISEMDIQDVKDLTDVLRAFENSIRNADRFINSYYKHTIHEAGLKVMNDINNSKGLKDNFFGTIDRFFINGTLSPERQIRRVVGYVDDDPLYIFTKELSAGQRRMLSYQKSSWDMFKDLMDDKKFINSLNGKKAREIEIKCMKDGKVSTIKVTQDVAISLYLSSMNDDNMRHMNKGGVEIPDISLYKKGKTKEAFRNSTRVTFSKEYLTAIKGMLTKQEIKFANKAYWYYNMVAPQAINEVSEILKGYSLARVENYFPIYVNKNFLERDFESLKFDGTIEGMGSLKERVKSGNPIMINGIVDTLTRSITENSMYVGLAMPVRNMNKLLGVKDIQKKNVEKDGVTELTYSYNGSVNESINKVWGEAVMQYIEKFMTDLQTNRTSNDDWENLLNKLRSNYAGAVLTLNASVAIKQTASYPTAMAVLGARPLARAMADIGAVNLDLIAKYTPLQWYRSQGYANKELGDIKSGRKDSVVDKVTSAKMLNWIQGMDLLTTRKLWKASEYYIRQQNKDLKVGSDEYYKAVAEIYNRVIEETQPNYTIMQRPGLLRSDKSLVQMMNMFKTQPYQNFNILYDAIGNYLAKRTQYMSSKTAESKEAFKQASKDMRNSVASQVIQIAVFAMMTSLWALFRGKDDKYKDEDGKITIESYMKQLGKDMISGLSAMAPLMSEAYSAVSSAFTGDYYYGFSSVTNATISDLFDSMNKALTIVPDIAKTVASGQDITDEQKKATKNLIESVSRFSGIPTTNVLNLYYGGARWASIAQDGKYVGEYEALKMTYAKDIDKKAVLWDAYKNDQKEYERLRKIMVDDGMKEDSLETYIKDKIKENPSEEQSQTYDAYVEYLEGQSTWDNFPEDKQEKVLKVLYKIAVGIEDSDTQGYTKRDMSPEKVALVKSALYEANMTYGNKNTSYDKNEKQKAVDLLKGLLTEKEKQEVLKGKW